MNTMTAEEERELADRIRSRGWGWKRAFDAWYLVHGGNPDIHLVDGQRVVARDATQFIKTNLSNLPVLGLQDVVQPDGTLQLDTAGKHLYRPLGELDHGFTAYERIT